MTLRILLAVACLVIVSLDAAAQVIESARSKASPRTSRPTRITPFIVVPGERAPGRAPTIAVAPRGGVPEGFRPLWDPDRSAPGPAPDIVGRRERAPGPAPTLVGTDEHATGPALRVYVPSEAAHGALIEKIKGSSPVTVITPAPEDPSRLVVAIQYRNWGSATTRICTGTILDGKHILTAGHCGCGDPSSYQIVIEDDIDKSLPDVRFLLAGPPILLDQRICFGERVFGADLALLTIEGTFRCETALWPASLKVVLGPVSPSGPNREVRPAEDCRLPNLQAAGGTFTTFGFPETPFNDTKPPIIKGTSLTAIGYGYTDTGPAGKRMLGHIPVLSPACVENYLIDVCGRFAEMVLAHGPGSARRTDTCGGDSGGPIFLIDGDRYTLIAVTSRAAPFAQDSILHCGGGGIYTLVGRKNVRDWLLANGVQPARTYTVVADAPSKPAEP